MTTKRAIILGLLSGAFLAQVSCETADTHSSSEPNDEESTDQDTGADADSDADSDVDDCTPGELFCVGDDVYECTGPNNQSELIEACPSPLVCINGMCVSDDECGAAIANKSNVGCEYYGVDMDNSSPTLPYAIAVSNLDAAEVYVIVEERNSLDWNILEEAYIEAKSVHVFMLGNNTIGGSYHQQYQAYRVTSDLPVVAYQFNPYAGLQPDDSDICTNDGSLLIPTSGLDMYYYALTYPPNVGKGMVVIAGTEDATTVSVTPTATIDSGINVPYIAAGNTETFLIQASDVLQLESSGDLSGTYIESDKKIAVWGGDRCAFVPSGISWCDHLEHQLFPLTTWGQEFVAARSEIRTTDGEPENDYWRVIAAENGTYIETDPTVTGLDGVTLNAGQVVEAGVNYSFTISATEPIMVGQFLTGHDATDVIFEGAGGDPAFALLPPHEQFMSSYVFLAPEKYLLDYVVITHPAGLLVNLDDNPVNSNPDCITMSLGADWGITRCLIPDFTHTVDAAEGVGISVWGYGGRVSYGYTGGLNLETINPVIPE